MPRLKHTIGSRFGRLVITQRNGTAITCKCDCGKNTVVHIANLCTGHTTSCGCLRTEKTIKRSSKHGHAKRKLHSATYHTWSDMIKRCSNPKNKSWSDYGGRGIKVCDEWHAFENFLKDMGEKPVGFTIDRINVNGPYKKDNCKWSTRTEQNRNTRQNHILSDGLETKTLQEWANSLGISHSSLIGRLKRGWPIQRALSEPPKNKLPKAFEQEAV